MNENSFRCDDNDVDVTWHSGNVPEELVDDLAKLFVEVDSNFGDEPWWRDVRRDGIAAAADHIRSRWFGFATGVTPDGQVVAFGALSAPFKGSVEISRVMVHPGWQRRGIGERVLLVLRDQALERNLMPWVDVLNRSTHAIALYEKTGFRTVSFEYGRDSGRSARQMRYK